MNSHTISAAWLREQRPENGVLPISAELAPMLADALEIADVCAIVYIESECSHLIQDDGQRLYDVTSAGPGAFGIEQAARYLEARRLLQRSAFPHLARLVEEVAG